MKKVLIVFMALVWTASLMAQRIAVVDRNGSTQIFKTLQEAIEGAEDNSVIYLPGGRFSIANNVRINKKLTVIGIGYNANSTENVDGRTLIQGNLQFAEGSSGSAVMGCYLTDCINIGTLDKSAVNDFLVKYCDVWDINVNGSASGTIINQNYIRSAIYFNGTGGEVTNNIMGVIYNMNGGIVSNNCFCRKNYGSDALQISNAIISDNVFVSWKGHSGSEVSAYHNLFIGVNWGDDCLNLTDVTWSDVFIKDDGVLPTSNYHFKDAYKQYESQYGIYSGTGFSDDQLPPVPYIVEKHIDQQTDASGHLNVRIRVKAGGTE